MLLLSVAFLVSSSAPQRAASAQRGESAAGRGRRRCRARRGPRPSRPSGATAFGDCQKKRESQILMVWLGAKTQKGIVGVGGDTELFFFFLSLLSLARSLALLALLSNDGGRWKSSAATAYQHERRPRQPRGRDEVRQNNGGRRREQFIESNPSILRLKIFLLSLSLSKKKKIQLPLRPQGPPGVRPRPARRRRQLRDQQRRRLLLVFGDGERGRRGGRRGGAPAPREEQQRQGRRRRRRQGLLFRRGSGSGRSSRSSLGCSAAAARQGLVRLPAPSHALGL